MRERTVHADRRMNDVEALMWNVEKDPFLSSSFGNITVLDRAPDLGYLRARLLQTASRIPRLHQRVAPGFGRVAPPSWQDDPDFDIDFHLRHVALPPPGSMRQLEHLACALVADPFDRTRPLWEFTVVEGLADGRAALIQKMHHTITDGEGGIRMSEQFIDIARQPPAIEVHELPRPDAGDDEDSLLDAARESFGHSWRRGLGVLQRAASGAAQTAAHPTELLGLGGEVTDLARSTVRQVTVTDRAHSTLWRDRSLRRQLETLDVPFDEAKRAAKSVGASLNDLFVTAAVRGAAAYHLAAGTPVASLRMAMPVSTRRDGSASGNSFVPTRVVLPADVTDPVDHLLAVHELLSATKQEKVIGVVGAVAGLANLLPTSVLVRFTRQQVETIDFTTSNVRAAPFDLYIAGAKLEANYPIGPLAGTAWNLTMMSYRGTLHMGLHVDAGAVADPEGLRDAIALAHEELITATGP